MADKPDDGPSLEMPSFSLRRKKGRTAEPEAGADTTAAPQEAPPEQERQPEPQHEPRAPRATLPTLPTLPALPGLTAAAVTGAVVGALAVLMTWLATVSCDAIRGTSSCGGGPGFLILVAVLVVLAWAGALLLGAFGVPDPGSTSVLAVGITAVLVMLFLLDSIYDGWMVIAIPVVSVVAFVGSWWITNAVVESD